MNGLFSPDSLFVRVMSKAADLILLNVVFLLTCAPIFTIGASITALYTVCFRMGTPREGKLFADYFRAFRDNFRKGTALWLIAVAWIGVTVLNAVLCYSLQGALHNMFLLFVMLLVLAVLIFGYAFPLLSQFENTVKGTMKNALLLSIGYFPRSLIIGVVNVFPVALLLTNFVGFLRCALIWVAVWFAAAAYGNTMLLRKVFAPYLSNGEREDDCSENQV